MCPLYDNFINIATFARTVPGFLVELKKDKGILVVEQNAKLALSDWRQLEQHWGESRAIFPTLFPGVPGSPV